MNATQKKLIEDLKRDILSWEGFKPPAAGAGNHIGLGGIERAFPNGIFPRGAIHEFVCVEPEDRAACDGFIGGLLSKLMSDGGISVWVSAGRRLFPTSLGLFNVDADRIIFMDVSSEKKVLWIIEEALKCDGLAAVVAEVSGLNITESRRLQLAVEQSGVTGMVLRKDGRKLASTISTARWKITPLPSQNEDNLPGVGYPHWAVELLKVRNGNPGRWQLIWSGDRFEEVDARRRKLELPVRLIQANG